MTAGVLTCKLASLAARTSRRERWNMVAVEVKLCRECGWLMPARGDGSRYCGNLECSRCPARAGIPVLVISANGVERGELLADDSIKVRS